MTKKAGNPMEAERMKKSLMKQIGYTNFRYVELALAHKIPSEVWIKIIKSPISVVDKKQYYKIFYEEVK